WGTRGNFRRIGTFPGLKKAVTTAPGEYGPGGGLPSGHGDLLIHTRRGGPMSDSILILDDDPRVLDTLAFVLEDLAIPLLRSTDPLAALDMVRTQKPRVVITDLMMPQMGGLEVLRAIKSMDPTIQVILVTGFG